jgi:hypothetical protein
MNQVSRSEVRDWSVIVEARFQGTSASSLPGALLAGNIPAALLLIETG